MEKILYFKILNLIKVINLYLLLVVGLNFIYFQYYSSLIESKYILNLITFIYI